MAAPWHLPRALPAALVAGAFALAACGGSSTGPSSAGGDAPGRPRAMGPLDVPVQIVEAKGSVGAMVTLTIHGRPFVFKVDTGATRTVVDASVARQLGLEDRGSPETVTSLGCSTKVQPVAIDDWRLGSAELPRSTVAASDTQLGGTRVAGIPVGGLLGNDVLWRYGSLRIDFKAKSLTLGAGPPRRGRSADAKVTEKDGEVRVVAPVAIQGTRAEFIVDTGAPFTTIDSGLARRHRLRPAGRALDASAVTCSTRIQPVRLDRWSMGSVRLPPVVAASSASSITKKTKGAIAGLLGTDVMAELGGVTIDFRGQKVVFGR